MFTLGAVELVDVSNDLPGLISCPGLQKWKVLFRYLGSLTDLILDSFCGACTVAVQTWGVV